ncbi:MAG: cytochrome-c oxidase, cbb3-type subunit III [Gammaproteobacteria bacterium]
MSKETKQTVQTTGHAWDGDLQEFNNPLPNWWLWSFYATVVFAIIYWVLFPTFPVGKNFTKGVMNDITYVTSDGTENTTHWNTRSLHMKEMQLAREMQQPYLEKIQAASYVEIGSDQDMRAFAYSTAKVLFADNCAACHQTGGAGVIGLYPNLADDAWLWGGSHAQIEASIREGRVGMMPGFKARFTDAQMGDMAAYVLSLSQVKDINVASARRGQAMFDGAAACSSCHTQAGSGDVKMGAANLTDQVWTVANVPGAATVEGKLAEVKQVIASGINRHMPAWKERLSETEIKMLTFYVHELGGGQ